MHKKKVSAVFGILLLAILVGLLIFLYNHSLTGLATYVSPSDGSTTEDSYIRSGVTADNNYGAASTLRIGNVSSTTTYRSIIKFDVSSIDSENTITSAKLQVYQESSYGSSSITIKAYRITSSWNELEVSWNNRTVSSIWSLAGGDYLQEIASVVFPASSGNYYNFSIETAVRGWVNGTYANYGLLLIAESATEGNYTYLSSSESPTEAQRPLLIVEYTENAAPIITEISTDSSLSNPKQVGEQVTFDVSWFDYESNAGKLFVCNSSSINQSGCQGYTFCSTSFSQPPSSCSYTISSSNNRTTTFYAAVCDTNCSEVNQSAFYMNHAPSISIVSPNGGETVNQSLGNYSINFTASDTDSDHLTADIYYSETQYALQHLIAPNVNLTAICTGISCSYSWDSTDVYGNYYIIIVVNDSFSISNDSSDSYFFVRSLVDNEAPQINAYWTDNDIYSGKITNFYANITEENINTVWISINSTTQINLTMFNITSQTYRANWTATASGISQYKIYANDTVGNINNTMPWQAFSIRKPNASSQNQYSPATALPFHVIKITGQLNASDAVKNIYAYLNVPEGFTFLSNYSQNTFLGNFTENETKTASWFVSVPLSEANYTLNITYSDGYSNTFQSSNFYVSVTSDIGGGYLATLDGYPEVETGDSYFVKAFFTKAGSYTEADSVYISIYDSIGNLIAGPASMSHQSTGTYNYTYSIGASVNEGQWQSIINATKSGVSYFASEFWKVVGGPFDVRTITVLDSTVDELNISVIAENTGGADKDLTLVWNLTREDNGAQLASEAETFMVPADSERTWYIAPSTSYVGQVRITFLGHYSGTEKAGAYKIFSTTSGNETPPVPTSPSGGGGAPSIKNITKTTKESEIEIDAERIIYLTKNIEKNITVTVSNTGEETLTNISLSLEGLNPEIYSITPKKISSLDKGEKAEFIVKFLVTETQKEHDFNYIAASEQTTETAPAKIIILSMGEYFSKILEKLRNRIKNLKDAEECEKITNNLESNINNEEFLEASDNAEAADICITAIEDKIKASELPQLNIGPYFIGIGSIIIFVIIISAVIVIYLIYRKITLVNFFKQEMPEAEIRHFQEKSFYDEIKQIEDRLK